MQCNPLNNQYSGKPLYVSIKLNSLSMDVLNVNVLNTFILSDRWSFLAPRIENYRFVGVFTSQIDGAFEYPHSFKRFNKPFENFHAESVHQYFGIELGLLRKIYKSIHD